MPFFTPKLKRIIAGIKFLSGLAPASFIPTIASGFIPTAVSGLLFPKLAVIFSSLGLIALFWPAFHFWSPLLYLLVLAAILILISYREDISIPLISSLLKQEYFKTKFKINRQENELAAASRINKAGKSALLLLRYFYLKILYYLIILFKSSHDSFAAVREEAQDIYKELIRITNQKDSGEDEIIDIEIIKERLAKGQTVDPRIFDKIEQELFTLHKRRQKKAAVFSLSGLSAIITATIIVSLALNLVLPSLPFTHAATYTFNQTDWSGGQDQVNNPQHPDNQSNWTKFWSKDAEIDTSNNEIKTAGTSGNWTETSDADFNAGATSTGYIYVASNTISPQKPDGYACTATSDCLSGSSCVGNVCIAPCSASTVCGNSCAYSGVVYTTVSQVAGAQCWLGQNLNYGTLVSGSSNQSNDSVAEKYCYSNSEAICTMDGGLYRWAEAMALPYTCNSTDCSGSITSPHQGICPSGWHIATKDEWYVLINYLKDAGQTCNAAGVNVWGCSTAGTKLQSGGTSGFNALLAGNCYSGGSFLFRGTYIGLWASTQYDASGGWSPFLNSSLATVFWGYSPKITGLSVRCAKN